MLEKEIAMVERGSDVCIPGPVANAWFRIKTALAELGTTPNTDSVEILLKKTKELISTWRDSPEPGDASVFIALEELDEFIVQNFTRA
jgi:hypothetical protein